MKERQRIAVCSSQVPFRRGGAEFLTDRLLSELQKKDHLTEDIRLPFRWYPNESLLDSCLAWRLMDISESDGLKIDRVIATKFPSYGVRHPQKVIWLVHQLRQAYDLFGTSYSHFSTDVGDEEARERVAAFDRECIGEARKVFAISRTVADRLHHYTGLKAEVLYHPPPLEGRYVSAPAKNFLLSVGRLDALKRTDLFLQSLAHSASELSGVVVGTGPEEASLRKMASELGLGNRVRFEGFVKTDRLLELYASCMAVFHAPYEEDYGYVALEALSSEKPVITTADSGGVLEFIEDGKTGRVAKAEPSALAGAIRDLVAEPVRAREMGSEGNRRVGKLSWNGVVDRLLE